MCLPLNGPWCLLALLTLPVVVAASAADTTQFRGCKYTSPDGKANKSLTLDDLNVNASIYWGVSVNWPTQTLDQYSATLGGRHPAIVNLFLESNDSLTASDAINCQIAPVISYGALLMLTVEPTVGLDNTTFTDGDIARFTTLCSDINDVGTAVLLRFGHEMNGVWYTWGQDPPLYKEAYIRLAKSIKANTTKTVMVWSPNTGYGYPFTGSASEISLPNNTNSERFKQLDTDGNGVFNSLDDPYSPYYPGDAYVDWVGLSLYSKRNESQSTAQANDLEGRTSAAKYISTPGTPYDFYSTYATAKNKPFLVTETAAAYYLDSPTGDGFLAVKQSWWRQLLGSSVLASYPLLKGVVWFEYVKSDLDSKERLDYTITYNPAIADAFVDDLQKNRTLDDVRFGPEHVKGTGGAGSLGGGNGSGNGSSTGPGGHKSDAPSIRTCRVLSLGSIVGGFCVAWLLSSLSLS